MELVADMATESLLPDAAANAAALAALAADALTLLELLPPFALEGLRSKEGLLTLR